MKSILLPVLLLNLLVSCSNGNKKQGKKEGGDPLEITKGEALIKNAVDSFLIPSMSAAVYKNGNLVFNFAYGIQDIHSKLPVNNKQPYHIGSITKSVTATMIGYLVEEGKLKWETRIIDIFPKLDSLHSSYTNATIVQLLSHTSGIVDLFTADDWQLMKYDTLTSPRQQKTDLMIKGLKNPKNLATGKDWSYANLNYTIASLLAEQVSNKTWKELVQTYIEENMDIQMGFGWARDSGSNTVPKGHVLISDIHDGYIPPAGTVKFTDIYEVWGPDFPHKVPISIQPAGDIYMKVSDLAKYGSFHINGLESGIKGLSKANFKILHNPILENYALGWNIISEGTASLPGIVQHQHLGSAGTFSAVLAIFPEQKVSIAIIHNGGGEIHSVSYVLAGLGKLFLKMK